MQLLNPAAWLTVFVPLILVLFYLLRGEKQERPVASLLLWQNLQLRQQAARPLWRLRPDLLFWLQQLILATLILALLQPAWMGSGQPQEHIVLILDQSASMQAQDVAPSRFREAQRQAADFIAQIGSSDQVALVGATHGARLVQGFTTDRQRLLGEINALRPGDEPGQLQPALELAESLLSGTEQGRVVVFSDGSGPEPAATDWSMIVVGQEGENLGITAVDVRHSVDDEYMVMASLVNYGEVEVETQVILRADHRILLRRSIEVPPGVSSQIFSLTLGQPTPIEMELVTDDAFILDNTVYMLAGTAPPLRLLLAGPGNYFLERALLADPRVQAFRLIVPEFEALDLTPAQMTEYDLLVFDRVQPPEALPRPHVFLDTAPIHWAEPQQRQNVELVTWEHAHPLFRFVDFSDVRLGTLSYRTLPDYAQVLAWGTGDVSLIAAGQKEQQAAWIYIGFGLHQTSFPLQVGFPIFWANLVRWLYPTLADGGMQAQTGHSLIIPYSGRRLQQVLGPDGQEVSFAAAPQGWVISELSRVGFYQAQFDDGSQQGFAVNLASPVESKIGPRQLAPRPLSAPREGTVSRQYLLWRYLAALALLLLLLEWYVYFRPTRLFWFKGGRP